MPALDFVVAQPVGILIYDLIVIIYTSAIKYELSLHECTNMVLCCRSGKSSRPESAESTSPVMDDASRCL